MLHNIPGKSNSKADLLSQRAGFDQGHDDNRDVTLLPPNIFVNLLQKDPTLLSLNFPYTERIHRARQNLDLVTSRAIDSNSKDWQEVTNGIFSFLGQIY